MRQPEEKGKREESNVQETDFWAIPVFDYVDRFNTISKDVQIRCFAAERKYYVHLSFRPADKLKWAIDNILFVSIVHNGQYQVSGHFSLKSRDIVTEQINKERAVRIAGRYYFNKPFSITDEEHASEREFTPSPLPHLVYKYDGDNDFDVSELHFPKFKLEDFTHNTLESQLRRFQRIVREEDGE